MEQDGTWGGFRLSVLSALLVLCAEKALMKWTCCIDSVIQSFHHLKFCKISSAILKDILQVINSHWNMLDVHFSVSAVPSDCLRLLGSGILAGRVMIKFRAYVPNMFCCETAQLTDWSRGKMDDILRMTFSNALFWMKLYEFFLRLHWILFPKF